MARLRLRYVDEFKDRHGNVRRYFRRAGHKRVRLPGLPGSTGFMEAYQRLSTAHRTGRSRSARAAPSPAPLTRYRRVLQSWPSRRTSRSRGRPIGISLRRSASSTATSASRRSNASTSRRSSRRRPTNQQRSATCCALFASCSLSRWSKDPPRQPGARHQAQSDRHERLSFVDGGGGSPV